MLCGIAVALLARTARAVAAACGSHYSYHLRSFPAPEPGRLLIGERADGSPCTVPCPVPVARPGEPAFTYTLREPLERVPGKSNVTGAGASADMAGISADADALAGGDLDVVVTERGNIFELDQAEAAGA